MYTNNMYAIKQPSMAMTNIYRAKVVYSNPITGEIRVIIPALIGPESQVAVSYWGRSASNGVWVVPDVDAQIVVAADDYQLTNVFWLALGGN